MKNHSSQLLTEILDFSDLFPGRDITSGTLTVVTLTQKTQNDMSGWNEHVELEREELIACVSYLLKWVDKILMHIL